MNQDSMDSQNDIDALTRVFHLGLVLFGLAALASGDFAGDYRQAGGLGYAVHKWIGIGVAFFIGGRLAYGIWGPAGARFSNWVPWNRERLQRVWEDLAGFAHFKLPDRPSHQGVAALVETGGLLLFLFLATTGVLMFFTIVPGQRAQGVTRFIKELHEAGEVLLPLFFAGHGGAVVLHALTGKHLWRKMVFLKER
jgi:cytochrome b